MSIIGKLHEISFYGLISTIICLCNQIFDIPTLISARLNTSGGFDGFFMAYLFWSSVLFIPIAIVGAFQTKYSDGGVGLSFYSNNLFVIFFAHIAEEILGLIATPFFFLMDVFKGTLDDGEKIMDYITWVLEIAFILFGMARLFKLI